jgi:hypothetical protein
MEQLLVLQTGTTFNLITGGILSIVLIHTHSGGLGVDGMTLVVTLILLTFAKAKKVLQLLT